MMLVFLCGGVFALAFRQGIVERDSFWGFVYQSIALVTLAGAVAWAG